MTEDVEYLRNLVTGFRMTELCTLMIFAGRSKSGRKTELQTRGLQLVNLNSPDINQKIRELHNSMCRSVGSLESETTPESMSSGSYSNPYHSPIPDSPPVAHNRLPTYPDVTLKDLPFYDNKATLLKPCSLQAKCTARFQEQSFTFHLTPAQASQVSGSSYRNEFGRPEYRTQIQMRFCLMESTSKQADSFPSSISVKVNSRCCPLPTPIPTNKPGQEPKRPPKPINITNMCKLSATSPNSLHVSWAVESGKSHTVSVYLVENLTYQDLLARLKRKGERNPDFTKALIKEKLKDQDTEIATTSCKVTLACPLGKMRMNVPCRATTCDHLQCFDASLYLQMNEKKPKWTCPVCNQEATNENLMIDGFFMELLESPRLPPDEHEIVLHNDGTWDPLPPKKEEVMPVTSFHSSSVSNSTPVPIEDSDSEGANSSGYNHQEAARPVKHSPPAGNIECIDLDSDSDEEEMPNKRLKLSSPVPLSSSSNTPPSLSSSSNTPPLPNRDSGSPDLICLD